MSLWGGVKNFFKDAGAVISWPFTHAHMIDEVVGTVETDLPPTMTALAGLGKQFSAIAPDVLAAVAANGFNVTDDIKSALDLKGIFTYVQGTLWPQVEEDFTDLKLATAAPSTSTAVTAISSGAGSAPAGTAAPASASAPVNLQGNGPSIHTQVPA